MHLLCCKLRVLEAQVANSLEKRRFFHGERMPEIACAGAAVALLYWVQRYVLALAPRGVPAPFVSMIAKVVIRAAAAAPSRTRRCGRTPSATVASFTSLLEDKLVHCANKEVIVVQIGHL